MSKICIIGMGYVGLPLAVAFAEKYSVIGYDINKSRISDLMNGIDATQEVSEADLADLGDNLKFTADSDELADASIYIVTVPTPIDKSNRPDLTPLISASDIVGKALSAGDIVIYESTVYPGVTEDVCVPILEQASGLRYNMDFFCGYSPERINPGDKARGVKSIVKVTAGSNEETAKQIDALYASVITAGTCPVSSIKVAEASKVIENTQRDVNIALINELAIIFNRMGINTREVIEAASSKWNFLKFQPGLVGGHCIGVDPYYLTFKAEELGYKPNLILASRQINNGMGSYVAEAAIKELILKEKLVKGARVLILGFTFKENCPDTRNTRVVDVLAKLDEYGVESDIYDPWVQNDETGGPDGLRFIDNLPVGSERYDAIILAVNHSEFATISEEDFRSLVRGQFILVDVKSPRPYATWSL